MKAAGVGGGEAAPGRLTEFLLGLVLRLYPPRFREQFTESLIETFHFRYQECRERGELTVVSGLRWSFSSQ